LESGVDKGDNVVV